MKKSKLSILTLAIILTASFLIITTSCEKDDDVGKAESMLLMSGDNQTGKITKELTNAIEIIVKYQNGAAFKNSEVSFETNDGSVSQSTVMTDADGKAVVNWTLTNNFGTHTLNVKAFKEDGITALEGSPITVTATAVCIEVGDEYAGGIVIYVDDNCGGIVCAKTDQNSGVGIQWSDHENLTTNARGTAVGTGQANTTAIVSIQGININYAARVCDELDLEGYTDWYLPSKDELNLMFNLAEKSKGNFQDKIYWNSTEEPYGTVTGQSGNAWCQEFDSTVNNFGNQYNDGKDNEHRVRAVRTFVHQ